MKDKLDSKEFYDLMQSYRNAPLTSQQDVIFCFEEIKRWIRKNIENECEQMVVNYAQFLINVIDSKEEPCSVGSWLKTNKKKE